MVVLSLLSLNCVFVPIAYTTLQDLAENGVEIELMHLGSTFDTSLFYQVLMVTNTFMCWHRKGAGPLIINTGTTDYVYATVYTH